jgi:hypothetical protein
VLGEKIAGSAIVSTINPTLLHMESNSGRRDGESAINDMHYWHGFDTLYLRSCYITQ